MNGGHERKIAENDERKIEVYRGYARKKCAENWSLGNAIRAKFYAQSFPLKISAQNVPQVSVEKSLYLCIKLRHGEAAKSDVL